MINKWAARALYVAFVALSSIAMKIGWLIPDGAGYASYLASLFLDGDLNFWNQYALSGIITPNLIHGATLTANGYVFTFWAIGAPLLWMPFWLIGHLITLIGHHFGQSWTANGFTIYYNIGVRFGTALMGLCALIMTAAWARKYSGSRAAALGVFLAAIGTPYYWYLFNFGDCSHVPASFAISLFLIIWEAYRTDRENKTGFLLGLLGGFVTMVKPNLVFIFLFPLAIWIAEWRKQPRILLMKQAGYVLVGSAVTFALQMWIWQILFGNPFGPIMEKGVAHYYKFFAGHFWLLDVLFSSYHGLFFFAPITICTFIGLACLTRVDRVVAIPSLLILISQILLMANERYFWEGGAFGLRRVVDCTPVFAFGIAYSLKAVFKRKWVLLPTVATAWTVLLAFTYNRHPIGLLNEYQPPRLILSWMGDALRHFPDAIVAAFSIPAPPKLFLPALLIFAVFGYFIYKAILRLADLCTTDPTTDRRHSFNGFTVVVLVFLLTGYALVGRAAVRGEQSKIRYVKQLQWLANRQDSIMALEESSFLVNEGKYVALSRNWDSARASFREALEMTPMPEQTSREIADFAKEHLSDSEAQQYMDSLNKK